MADNVGITPGTGAIVGADDVDGVLIQRVKLDLGGDGLSQSLEHTIPAMPISTSHRVITLRPTVYVGTYTNGNIFFEQLALSDYYDSGEPMRISGGHVKLESVMVMDLNANRPGFDLVFLNANYGWGIANAVPDDDGYAKFCIVGHVNIPAATDWMEIPGTSTAVYTLSGLSLVMKAVTGFTNLWVTGLNVAGAPTYSSAVQSWLKLGFSRD